MHFPADLRLTPEQFTLVCASNREALLGLAAVCCVIAMAQIGSETGSRNGQLVFQLKRFVNQ
jgi:hypothetical protein